MARGVGVQVDEQLPVREPVPQHMRHVHRQGGLPDPRHPVDRTDRHHPARPAAPISSDHLRFAAGERGDVGRQRAGGSVAPSERLGKYIPGYGRVSARGSLKPGPVVPRQAEGIRQPPGSVLTWGPTDPAFQVTDGPVTHPGGVRQLFLSQAGSCAQRAQQAAKRYREQLGHLEGYAKLSLKK